MTATREDTIRELRRITHPIARADYECDLCHEEIPKGSRYCYERGFVTGPERFDWTLRACGDEEACAGRWSDALGDEYAEEARKAGATT